MAEQSGLLVKEPATGVLPNEEPVHAGSSGTYSRQGGSGPVLEFVRRSEVSEKGFGPLFSVARQDNLTFLALAWNVPIVPLANGIKRARKNAPRPSHIMPTVRDMELLANVWDVPLASATHDIKEIKKGNYVPVCVDVMRSIVLTMLIMPRLLNQGAVRVGEHLVKSGATRFEMVRKITHPKTGESASIRILKYVRTNKNGQEILYQAFHDNEFLISKSALRMAMESEEALDAAFLAEVEAAFW